MFSLKAKNPTRLKISRILGYFTRPDAIVSLTKKKGKREIGHNCEVKI